ncbi:MAG: hypothetical protein NT046_13065 [Arenimonas sp.]|nr:hypothetical protein [Arenimonas sp.]
MALLFFGGVGSAVQQVVLKPVDRILAIPGHLLLGNDAFEGAMARVEHSRQDLAAGEAVARAADFPKQKTWLRVKRDAGQMRL